MWTRQDDRKDTILHRAVRNNYDARVINLILRADSKVCSVKDGTGCLAVEVVLRACDSYGKFTYEELPLDLLCMLFEKMTSADIDHAIAASSAADRISHQREVDFRTLAKSLKQIRAVRSINVHLLGHGCAGKSTLRSAFRHTLPNPSRYYGYASSLFGYRKYVDSIEISDRTVGCEVETIKYDNQHWRFFDYGGQEKFHANHDRFLRMPGSLYIIVVALCDFRQNGKPKLTWQQIREKYTYWLRFLASTFEADAVPEIFTVLNGKSHVDKPFIDEIRKKIRDEQMWWVTFKKACWKDEEVHHNSNVTTLRFLNDDIPCIDNNHLNGVRDALNDVMVQTIVRVQREANLYPQILSEFDRIKADAKADRSFPEVINMNDFKKFWLGKAVDSVGAGACTELKDYLKDWMLQRLLDLKEITLINKESILTDETWVTRTLLGQMIASIKKSEGQKCLLTSQDILKLIGNGVGNEYVRSMESSIGDLLESIGACVRVKLDPKYGAGSSRSQSPPATSLLFFPMIKVLVDADAIRPMTIEGHPNKVGQQIMRKFKLRDCAFSTFPPGYFERLFSEIVSLVQIGKTSKGMVLDTYENALVLKCNGLMEEIIVKVEGDEFNVTVSTLTNIEGYGEDVSSLKSSAEVRLESIRRLIFDNKGPLIEESCTHPREDVSRPLVIKDLDDETDRQMFYGITCLNNTELKTESLWRSVCGVVAKTGVSWWPYSFVLISSKLGQSFDEKESGSGSEGSFLNYLQYVASTQWQILTPELKLSGNKGENNVEPVKPSMLWLYLLDQKTRKPIMPATSNDRYPILVSDTDVFIKKWLILILSSLSEMESFHRIVAIANLLEYPESELAWFFDTVGLYTTNLGYTRCVNDENIVRRFLKEYKLDVLESFYRDNQYEDIATLCNVNCVHGWCWTMTGHAARDDGQLKIEKEGNTRKIKQSSELKLECYILKKVSAMILFLFHILVPTFCVSKLLYLETRTGARSVE